MHSAAVSIALPLVLIADANPVSRQRRTRQLADRGFRVAVARTGFETIVKASCHLPDLILVAASLGESDADETTKLLSTCPATAHIPIVRLARGHRIPTRLDAVAR
jgi:CheY-like chemotaxis protein